MKSGNSMQTTSRASTPRKTAPPKISRPADKGVPKALRNSKSYKGCRK